MDKKIKFITVAEIARKAKDSKYLLLTYGPFPWIKEKKVAMNSKIVSLKRKPQNGGPLSYGKKTNFIKVEETDLHTYITLKRPFIN